MTFSGSVVKVTLVWRVKKNWARFFHMSHALQCLIGYSKSRLNLHTHMFESGWNLRGATLRKEILPLFLANWYFCFYKLKLLLPTLRIYLLSPYFYLHLKTSLCKIIQGNSRLGKGEGGILVFFPIAHFFTVMGCKFRIYCLPLQFRFSGYLHYTISSQW